MTSLLRGRGRATLGTTVAGLLSFALVLPPGAQAAPPPTARAATLPAVSADAAAAPATSVPATATASDDAGPVAPESDETGFVPEDEVTTEPSDAVDAPDSDRSAAPTEPAEPADEQQVTPDEPLVATADVTGFGVVGVTWSGDVADDALVVEVRTSQDPDALDDSDAGWDSWQEATAEPSPDGTLDGTEPVLVGDAARVQARVSGSQEVHDLALHVVDPGTSRADDDVPVPPQDTSGGGMSAATLAAPDRPTISSRAAWGADESIRTWKTRQGSVKAATIHHTAGTNNYSKSDVPRIIRGIYAYHAQTRGWGDIGYNFLVDKYGRTWEGRAGGITRQTIGGHAVGFNTNSTGISVLGNYDTATVSNSAVTAVVRLAAWKLALHGVPASGTTTINGTRLSRIFGHRDVSSTACPGRTLYNRLGEIRRRAVASQEAAAAKEAQGKIVDGSFVVNPNGNLALVENGRKHIAYCSVVHEYGKTCGSARKVTAAQWRGFVPGGRLQRTVRTTDGRLYRVDDGRKYEAADVASLERVKKKTKMVTLHADAIKKLPYGNPIVRPGVIVINRSNGNHRLVVAGKKHGYLGSALRNRTPLQKLDRLRLDGASVSRIPKVDKTTGVIKRNNGRQFLLTRAGTVRIDGTGRLRSSAKTQTWGKALMADVPRIKGKPRVVAVRRNGQSQIYILRDGVLRPVSKARAKQVNGGSMPKVHVILKLTKNQFTVGSRL